MALVVKDRVKETTTTTGTGTLTLAGAETGFQSFAAIGNANTTFYAIVQAATGAWEVGIGTYTASGTTLSRDTVLASSNAGAAVNLAAGSKEVFVTYPASYSFGTSQTLAIANGGTGETTRQAAMDALAGAVTSGQYLRGNGTDVVMSAIQAADVPTLNQNTTGTAANVSGVVAFANGGTGQTTRQAAMDALAGAVTAGQYLRGDGTDVVMSAIQAADVPTLNQNTTGTATNATNLTGSGSISSTTTATTAAEKTATTVVATAAFVDRLRSLTTPSTGTSGTLVVGDRGALVAATGAITVPASVFAARDVVTIANSSNTGAISLIQGSGLTLRLAGTTTTGTRTLAINGIATIVFISPTVALVSGGGLT